MSGPGAIFFCFVVDVVVVLFVVVEVCYIFSPGTFRFVYASPPGENQRFSESKMKMMCGMMCGAKMMVRDELPDLLVIAIGRDEKA